MYKRRLFLLGGIVLLATLLVASDVLYARIDDVLAWAGDLIARHPGGGIIVFVGLAALSAMVAFFSSVLIVPVGVQHWGPLACFGLLWVGWMLGGMAAYGIGRGLGRRAVATLINPRTLERYEAYITANLAFPLVLLFQAALPSEVPGYLLGMLRYRFARYLMALALVELPYALGAVYLGEGFLQRQPLRLIALGLGGVLLSALAYHYLHRRIPPPQPPGPQHPASNAASVPPPVSHPSDQPPAPYVRP
jgi:uncharacterized membrane protein YdjX (TVP38/TMEM64 family)